MLKKLMTELKPLFFAVFIVEFPAPENSFFN